MIIFVLILSTVVLAGLTFLFYEGATNPNYSPRDRMVESVFCTATGVFAILSLVALLINVI